MKNLATRASLAGDDVDVPDMHDFCIVEGRLYI